MKDDGEARQEPSKESTPEATAVTSGPSATTTETAEAADDASTDDASTDDASTVGGAAEPARRRVRPRKLVLSLAVLLVVLMAAATVLLVHNNEVSSVAADKASILQSAREVATNLTTITSENAAGQIDTLNRQSVGSFKDQLAGYSAMFQAVLRQGNVASTGEVTAGGIEKLEGDTATALIAVAARITSGEVPQGQSRAYRLAITMQRAGDQWLASNVQFLP